ncbi:triacylglycerol lipase OBL1 [Cryptomeria japonica]|uniref:triacylglycerol lipase OBL1 n=1 Tax=Cryptomeria japonica TaxID=3369 RepID=UPI0027D9E406|nr:triacylglycerol lipase OBL1 [Cryptomeria japonica]XP_057860726.2 triacylglycerol lipase OBL1 [Cryptomeria japonica]
MNGSKTMNPGDRFFADISVLASTIVYENPLVIRERVNHHWKMHFVELFECWNDYLKKKSTQAFILCDKEKDAKLIVIAFRGTQPFESDDYITDVDFSWYDYPQMGKVHFGFLEALGLANRSNRSNDKKFSCHLDPDNQGHSIGGAYNVLHKKLKELLEAHKNAKFIVTGHSLGGALAVLFTAMLFVNDEKLLENLLAIYTFGQPRVGDKTFADFMNRKLNLNQDLSRYFRIVYSNDLIPRIPFEDVIFMYKDFGACLYYNSFYSLKKLAETPNRNFSPVFFIQIKIVALWELLQCLVLHYREGKEFKETKVSIFCRILGVLSPGILIPGLSAHSPVNYINAVGLGPAILNPNLARLEN